MTRSSSDTAPLIDPNERPRLESEIARQSRAFCTHFRKSDPAGCAKEFLNEEKAREQLALLESFVDGDLDGRRLLEIGSGYSTFLAAARRFARAESYGVEPGVDEYMGLDTAGHVLAAAGVARTVLSCATGENLPFADCNFDVVCSWNVLEHVTNPQEVLREAYRVLRPGGRMVFSAPNYHSFWEGHYRVPWLPLLNWRPLGRLYLRLLGRDAAFFDTVHTVTPRKVLEWISALEGHPRVVTMGRETCAERLHGAPFAEWGGLHGVKRIVRWLRRLSLAGAAARFLGALDAYYPIILVVEKADAGHAAG